MRSLRGIRCRMAWPLVLAAMAGAQAQALSSPPEVLDRVVAAGVPDPQRADDVTVLGVRLSAPR